MRQVFAALLCAALGSAAAGGVVASSPDFWIAPTRYAVAANEDVVADLRTGSMAGGEAQSFAPAGLLRFEMVIGPVMQRLDAMAGDIPAIRAPAEDEGLAVLVHESIGTPKVWFDWSAFERFVTERGFDWAIQDHHARGLPETGFGIACQRFAKALVAVGNGEGHDRSMGLEAEVVALTNPYRDDLSAGMTVQVLYQGKPRKQAQITLYSRDSEGALGEFTAMSDMDGRALLAVQPGTEYIVETVILRPMSGAVQPGSPVWEALWATLSFRTPG